MIPLPKKNYRHQLGSMIHFSTTQKFDPLLHINLENIKVGQISFLNVATFKSAQVPWTYFFFFANIMTKRNFVVTLDGGFLPNLVNFFVNCVAFLTNSPNSSHFHPLPQHSSESKTWIIVAHSSFSQIHKVGIFGTVTNFVLPHIYSFLLYLQL